MQFPGGSVPKVPIWMMMFVASAASGSKSDATSRSTHNSFSARRIFQMSCVSGLNESVNIIRGTFRSDNESVKCALVNWRHISDVGASVRVESALEELSTSGMLF